MKLYKKTIPLALLIALASNILYLYYAGAWYDPWKWLEITEIVVLYAIIVGSIYLIIEYLREG